MRRILLPTVLIFLLFGNICTATPTLEEVPSKLSELKKNFSPIFPTVNIDWTQVIKKHKYGVAIIYLSANDTCMLIIDETNAKNGKGRMTTLATEQVYSYNDITYYFDPWADQFPLPGGIIRWTQSDIYFEMSSMELDLKQMMEIARTLNK
ncbi:MAG: hypothetical protein K6T85_07920 [Gorillibacterium sp.]|nr:hypothetical protein [Gorillibacterium sp.]